MTARWFFGPPDMELLGFAPDGVPVLGDDDGAERMTEATSSFEPEEDAQ